MIPFEKFCCAWLNRAVKHNAMFEVYIDTDNDYLIFPKKGYHTIYRGCPRISKGTFRKTSWKVQRVLDALFRMYERSDTDTINTVTNTLQSVDDPKEYLDGMLFNRSFVPVWYSIDGVYDKSSLSVGVYIDNRDAYNDMIQCVLQNELVNCRRTLVEVFKYYDIVFEDWRACKTWILRYLESKSKKDT